MRIPSTQASPESSKTMLWMYTHRSKSRGPELNGRMSGLRFLDEEKTPFGTRGWSFPQTEGPPAHQQQQQPVSREDAQVGRGSSTLSKAARPKLLDTTETAGAGGIFAAADATQKLFNFVVGQTIHLSRACVPRLLLRAFFSLRPHKDP
ncbi:hypothetical protein CEXT_654131 [Caerostris extrusa]|uniref:Uncharacterized protein n=1 Tax=Caerostris extrusa TaxID=172846 RepID=A0AAV4S063_CAEEX|nr:hypothetical protein CEXT_654131 [Caerostris extrusa]